MPNSIESAPVTSLMEILRESPEWLAIRHDDEAISSKRLRELSDGLIRVLKKLGPVRVALHAVRADMTLAAILAASESGCELLLTRELFAPDDPFWAEHKVAAIFNERLEMLHAPGYSHHPQKAAILLMTSGTTGKPKVAVHEMEKLLGRVRSDQIGNCWLLTYHPGSFAGIQVVLTAFCTRSLMVGYGGLSASELAVKAINSDITHLSGTPTFWRSLLLALPGEKSPPLRQITLGGEAVDQSILDALHAAFPQARIIHIYASTEAGSLFAVKDRRAGFPAQWLLDGVDGCRLRIRDGVLQVQSPRAMKRYGDEGSRPALSDDGWLITGDIVQVVADRVLFCGRVDSVINVGGGKVMPEQVEAMLLALPMIREARVYGIKNPLAGDVLAADVVLAKPISEAEARQHIFSALSARLEPHKVPRMYRFVGQIPTNMVGKKVRKNHG